MTRLEWGTSEPSSPLGLNSASLSLLSETRFQQKLLLSPFGEPPTDGWWSPSSPPLGCKSLPALSTIPSTLDAPVGNFHAQTRPLSLSAVNMAALAILQVEFSFILKAFSLTGLVWIKSVLFFLTVEQGSITKFSFPCFGGYYLLHWFWWSSNRVPMGVWENPSCQGPTGRLIKQISLRTCHRTEALCHLKKGEILWERSFQIKQLWELLSIPETGRAQPSLPSTDCAQTWFRKSSQSPPSPSSFYFLVVVWNSYFEIIRNSHPVVCMCVYIYTLSGSAVMITFSTMS